MLPVLDMLSHRFLCSSSLALNKTVKSPGFRVRTMQQQPNYQGVNNIIFILNTKHTVLCTSYYEENYICTNQNQDSLVLANFKNTNWILKVHIRAMKPPEILYICSALNTWERNISDMFWFVWFLGFFQMGRDNYWKSTNSKELAIYKQPKSKIRILRVVIYFACCKTQAEELKLYQYWQMAIKVVTGGIICI